MYNSTHRRVLSYMMLHAVILGIFGTFWVQLKHKFKYLYKTLASNALIHAKKKTPLNTKISSQVPMKVFFSKKTKINYKRVNSTWLKLV